MGSLAIYRNTEAWDDDACLPYFPKTNNGHLYCAYTVRLEGSEPGVGPDRTNFAMVAAKTDWGKKRWKSEIPVSHDELRGYFFLCWYFGFFSMSRDLAEELEQYGGSLKAQVTEDFRRNFFRILDMEAQLKAAQMKRPTPMEQAAYFFAKVFQAFTVKPGEASGILRTWLYVPLMMDFPVCQLALYIWSFVLTRRNFTLEQALRLEPAVPLLADRAKGRGWLE